MKLNVILIVILTQFLCESLGSWCLEKKPVLRMRANWGRRYRPYISNYETYYDFELRRVCCFGYQQNGDTCEPQCQPACSANSTCFAPNLCHCNSGYYGHDDHPNSINCKPYCDISCAPHSQCTAPNVCTCMDGYHKSNQWSCEPTCSQNCGLHGYCQAPELCACNPGYKSINNQCEPVCDKECPPRAICAEPNKCECMDGYQMKLTSLYEHYCKPICEPTCSTFAMCTAPNKCECFQGFQMNDNGTSCEPICRDDCHNGICISPDVCMCVEGYLMGPDNECQPVCKEPCQMGHCIKPNQCECEEGYTFVHNSTNICAPICEPQCENAKCVAPNFCVCLPDFTYADDFITNKCIPVPGSTTAELQTTEMEMKSELTTNQVDSNSESDRTIDMLDITTSTTIQYVQSEILTTETSRDTTKQLAAAITESSYVAKENLTLANNCLTNCQCWQQSDNMNSLFYTNCVHFCADNYDKPCLNATLCKCNYEKIQLYCFDNEKDDVGEGEGDGDNLKANEILPLKYSCKMWRSVNVSNEKIAKFKHHPVVTANIGRWLWLTGSIVIVLIIITSLIIYWRTHQRNPEYMVQFDQSSN